MTRLGLIIPSINTIIERDLRRFGPPDVDYHVARVRLNAFSEDALARAVAEIPQAAAQLHDAGLDAIALACTGAAMVAGSDPDRCAHIAGADGLPMTTITAALHAAFAALGTRRVALFSPFEPWFNEKEARMLEAAGLAVSGMHCLSYSNPRSCAGLTPEQIIEGALVADTPVADAIFLSCANIRAMEAIEAIEGCSGKPVLTSNQVVLWWLRHADGAQTAHVPGQLSGLTTKELQHG